MISIPGRIPIHISPYFWLVIGLLGWLNSGSVLGTVIWSIVILISVILHEYGHAITALAFGQRTEINLVGLGGLTKREGPKLKRWKEFLIVLNGPLAGLLTFLAVYYWLGTIGEKRTILRYALEVAVNVNLFWTLMNLLPVFPLDGGQLMRIFFEGIFGLKGLKFAFLLSTFIGGLIGLLFFFNQQVIMGALFFMLAFESYRAWEDVRGFSPQDTDANLQDQLKDGIFEFQRGDKEKALDKFKSIRQSVSKGALYVTATEFGARILAEQGQFKMAYIWLSGVRNRLSFDYLQFLQQLAYRVQEWEDAIKIGEEAFQIEPLADVALLNAFSYAILGEATPAVGWLSSAVQHGLKNVTEVVGKREFDAIRNSDVFKRWSTTL